VAVENRSTYLVSPRRLTGVNFSCDSLSVCYRLIPPIPWNNQCTRIFAFRAPHFSITNPRRIIMLKLNASYSKKVSSDAKFSSESYLACIEVELPTGMTTSEQ
jgi:hypothetical protein